MASVDRIRDVSKLDGKLENNIYSFPTLYNIDKSGRIHLWTVKVMLAKLNIEYELDWIPKKGLDINTKKGTSNEVGFVALVFTEGGIENMKLTRYLPTIIEKGMNVGKINETSIWEQGLISANGLYQKKLAKGNIKDRSYFDSEPDKSDKAIKSDKTKSVKYNKKIERIAPMALHKYSDFGDKHFSDLDGVYVQPKLDGVRAIARLSESEVDMYSRGNKNWNHLKSLTEELLPLLTEFPTLYLDGELYGDGLSLQQISSIRGETGQYNDLVKFNIFDIFFSDEPNMKWSERYQNIRNIFKEWKFKKITKVETKKIHSKSDLDKYYKKKLAQGYEGVVLRHPDGVYETELSSFKERRSYFTLKYKPRESDEFKIVGYSSGEKGKEKGAIKFDVEILMPKSKIMGDSKILTVTPNWPIEERYKAYKLAENSFDKVFKGKYATIEYDKFSDDGIPLYAKLIVIRDYE